MRKNRSPTQAWGSNLWICQRPVVQKRSLLACLSCSCSIYLALLFDQRTFEPWCAPVQPHFCTFHPTAKGMFHQLESPSESKLTLSSVSISRGESYFGPNVGVWVWCPKWKISCGPKSFFFGCQQVFAGVASLSRVEKPSFNSCRGLTGRGAHRPCQKCPLGSSTLVSSVTFVALQMGSRFRSGGANPLEQLDHQHWFHLLSSDSANVEAKPLGQLMVRSLMSCPSTGVPCNLHFIEVSALVVHPLSNHPRLRDHLGLPTTLNANLRAGGLHIGST